MQFTNLYTYENLLLDCTLGHVCLADLKMLPGLFPGANNKYANGHEGGFVFFLAVE